MRRSEIVGLRWSSIDFDNNVIYINHKATTHCIDGAKKIDAKDGAKTKSSVRALPLTETLKVRLLEIKEKQRISNYCTLGAYYFKTCGLYEDLYNEYYSKTQELVNGEKYVAPLYDYLLSKGGEIYISDIEPARVHVLGTPEELQAFLDE